MSLQDLIVMSLQEIIIVNFKVLLVLLLLLLLRHLPPVGLLPPPGGPARPEAGQPGQPLHHLCGVDAAEGVGGGRFPVLQLDWRLVGLLLRRKNLIYNSAILYVAVHCPGTTAESCL